MGERKGATPADAEESLGFMLQPLEHEVPDNSDLSSPTPSPCDFALFVTSAGGVIPLQRSALGMVMKQPLRVRKGQCSGEQLGAQLSGLVLGASPPLLEGLSQALSCILCIDTGKI